MVLCYRDFNPRSLAELQQDYAVVFLEEIHTTGRNKLLRRCSQYKLLVIDKDELPVLVNQANAHTEYPLRSLFVVVHSTSMTPNPRYFNSLNYVTVLESAFESLLTECSNSNDIETYTTAAVQGLPIALVAAASAYDTTRKYASHTYSDGIISSMVLAVQDFKHVQ
ncbi:hypothetical protein KIPB_011892 [Kipferlia bialata]|uniref:Uncharacterized protein n=1 Tax=Kipferlia bialata TaxID=797122 RepID=A0A9K3GNI9_9EUKA|nr:hypothetical protein KIPB_011892 [Kipferlia bialata]|eukprot:g11892.t1